jgi:hypothetical protein
MSALDNSIQFLLDFLKSRRLTPPSTEIRIFEVTNTEVDSHGRLHISRDALFKPSEYEKRFDELVQTGLPWINLSCYGAYESKLVVGVEFPKKPSSGLLSVTSINYSGPQGTVIQDEWRTDSTLIIA